MNKIDMAGELSASKLTKSDIIKGSAKSGWRRTPLKLSSKPHDEPNTPGRSGFIYRTKKKFKRLGYMKEKIKDTLKGALLTAVSLGGVVGGKMLIDHLKRQTPKKMKPEEKQRRLKIIETGVKKHIKKEKVTSTDFKKAEKQLLDAGKYDEYFKELDKLYPEAQESTRYGRSSLRERAGGGYRVKAVRYDE